MKIRERNTMPDGTKIQIEDWKEDYPGIFNTITIATYPKAKNTGKHNWVRRGESFRLELQREFDSDEQVEALFKQLVNGKVKLEDLSKHYWNGKRDMFIMGLRESED